ncbi:MAG: carbohydrate ABC transporter permease [Spirochaetales bacterium]|nr:carbohydrate ABC transporter permease [Spirochaetales bacterium]
MNDNILTAITARFVLMVSVIVILIPLVYLTGMSLKEPQDIFGDPVSPFSFPVVFSNFRAVIAQGGFLGYFLNSVLFAGGVTVGQLVMAVFAAYGMSFYRFRLKNLCMGLFLLSIIVPFVVTYVPNYLFLARFKLLNSLQGMVLPMLGVSLGFGVFLLYQQFQSFPLEIMDAARIDGASERQFLWKILVPSSMGQIVSVSIYLMINTWNRYIWPLLIGGGNPKSYTLNVAVAVLFNNAESGANWASLTAASVLSSLPLLILYFSMRKNVLESFLQGAVKG